MNTNELTKEIIAAKLLSSDWWLTRGVVAIFNKQTEDEKSAETTNRTNGIGFTGADARFGSGMAKILIAGYTLTPKQTIATRKMMQKYAGQLLRIAKEKSLQSQGTP
jgi:sulfur transfer protein SufE